MKTPKQKVIAKPTLVRFNTKEGEVAFEGFETTVEKEPSQNAKEIMLLRNILACVFEMEEKMVEKNWHNIELRARAIGLLEGMICYKELTEKHDN